MTLEEDLLHVLWNNILNVYISISISISIYIYIYIYIYIDTWLGYCNRHEDLNGSETSLWTERSLALRFCKMK